MVLTKVNFQDFLCKRLFCKMYLSEDQAGNSGGPSKVSQRYLYVKTLQGPGAVLLKVKVFAKVPQKSRWSS